MPSAATTTTTTTTTVDDEEGAAIIDGGGISAAAAIDENGNGGAGGAAEEDGENDDGAAGAGAVAGRQERLRGGGGGGGSDSATASATSATAAMEEVCYPGRVTTMSLLGRGGRNHNHNNHDKTCPLDAISSPPRQRQRWGDEQVLPHVNWGDLFFDLFYVAAAYNLSIIILESPSLQGLLYFVGCFGPVMSVWLGRMYYDSRFAGSDRDDIVHRSFEVLQLCLLATAVSHIRPASVMGDPHNNSEAFAFSLSVLLLTVASGIQYAEVAIRIVGEDGSAARIAARRDALGLSLQGVFYLAAAVVSGTAFYGNSGGGGGGGGGDNHYSAESPSAGYYGSSNTSSGEGESYGYNGSSTNSAAGGGDLRFLAGGEEEQLAASSSYDEYAAAASSMTTTNVPIYLCMAGWLSSVAWLLFMVFFLLPSRGNHKAVTVPMNIDFAIHRQGEWVMLLLGESVLSLLIVDVAGNKTIRYYVTFYAGVVSVVLLQYLHFRSQPHRADAHAMRRNKNAGAVYSTLNQLYSFALVAVGVSYKMLLYEYTYEDYYVGVDGVGAEHHRREAELAEVYDAGLAGGGAARHLAGGGAVLQYSPEDRQQRVANMFCGSMAVTWLCQDLMILSHRGLRTNAERCRCQRTNKVSKVCIVFATFRVALVVFIATLSQYVNDPDQIAIIGLAGIVMQVFTRILGDLVAPKSEKDSSSSVVDGAESKGKQQNNSDDNREEDSEEGHWPNVTHARAVHAAA